MKKKNTTKESKDEDCFEIVHACLRDGKFSEAINILLEQCGHGLNREFQSEKNHAWYCVGCAYFEMGNFDCAKKAFLNAYRYNINDIQSLIACGNCFSEMRKPELTEKTLKKALTKKPGEKEKAIIIYNLGNALFDQGLYDSAIHAYASAIKRRDEIGVLSRKNAILARQLLRENNFFAQENANGGIWRCPI